MSWQCIARGHDKQCEQIFLDIQPFGLADRAIMDDVGAGVLDARYNMTGTYSAWLTKVKGGLGRFSNGQFGFWM